MAEQDTERDTGPVSGRNASPKPDQARGTTITRLEPANAGELYEAAQRSRELLHPWVYLPDTLEGVSRELAGAPESTIRYGVRTPQGELAGVINLNGILRGAFCNAYLGYYALTPHNGRGMMREGLLAVIDAAFSTEHGLHRLEANVQPKNRRSSRLIESLGFRLEGHSPNYLKIGGQWRSHDRYALTVEDVLSARQIEGEPVP